MMDDPVGPPLAQRHVERVEHEVGLEVRRHRPAHDAAAEHVEHDREEQEAGPRRHVGDVRDPELIRGGDPNRHHRGEPAIRRMDWLPSKIT